VRLSGNPQIAIPRPQVSSEPLVSALERRGARLTGGGCGRGGRPGQEEAETKQCSPPPFCSVHTYRTLPGPQVFSCRTVQQADTSLHPSQRCAHINWEWLVAKTARKKQVPRVHPSAGFASLSCRVGGSTSFISEDGGAGTPPPQPVSSGACRAGNMTEAGESEPRAVEWGGDAWFVSSFQSLS
jgi:hypothetical protein